MAYLEYTPSTPLFHYTSYEGFKGIIDSGAFWLSDLTCCSNDPREQSMAKEKIIKAISRFDQLQLPKQVREQTQVLTDQLLRQLDIQQIFSLCLTPNRDSLTEWKEYAAQGRGISFSIRPRALRDMYVRVQKVKYVDEYEQVLFDNIIEAQYEQLRYASPDGPSFEQQVNIVSNLLSSTHSIKHKSWESEREIRLTFASSVRTKENISVPLSAFPDDSEVSYRTPLKRNVSNVMIDYYSIPFGRYQKGKYDITGAVDEVIIGPNCNVSIAEVGEFITKQGLFNAEVLKSACSFNPR